MKIFRFLPNNINTGATLYKDMGVATIPDTALLIQKRPFFIPDFTQQCVAQLCVCARINRLGRSINERFAQCYYNANEMCLGVHFIAQDLLKELQCNNKPWDLAIGFDNAVAVAEGKQTMPMSDSLKATVVLNDMSHTTMFSRKLLCNEFDHQIAQISQHYTMKQGDLLLMPLNIELVEVHIDDHVSLMLNDQSQLAFNIK